jgi:hypothetical protein
VSQSRWGSSTLLQSPVRNATAVPSMSGMRAVMNQCMIMLFSSSIPTSNTLMGFPGSYVPPQPLKSPRVSYDAGEAFAQHMHGCVHDDSNHAANINITGSAPDACGDSMDPSMREDDPLTSAKLSEPAVSMDGVWQMLTSEPTLMARNTEMLLEPRPIAEMERSLGLSSFHPSFSLYADAAPAADPAFALNQPEEGGVCSSFQLRQRYLYRCSELNSSRFLLQQCRSIMTGLSYCT